MFSCIESCSNAIDIKWCQHEAELCHLTCVFPWIGPPIASMGCLPSASNPQMSCWSVRARHYPVTIKAVCCSQGSPYIWQDVWCVVEHPSNPAAHPTPKPYAFWLDGKLPPSWHVVDKQPQALFPCALWYSENRVTLITKRIIKHSSIM